MSHNILITGGSGYLGGTLLANLGGANLPQYQKIYALVRSKEQEQAVRQYGVEPVVFDLANDDDVVKNITDKKISIIYFLIDALNVDRQVSMIKALSEVKKETGLDVHFVHTSGAKVFSEHSGHPTDRPLLDTDPSLYDIQKSSRSPYNGMNVAVQTNNTVIETAEAYGVRSYIFIPCIVYGEGEGFGNRISIQTVAVVKAAAKLRQVYNVNREDATWPVSHVRDNTTLYIEILRKILLGEDPGHGKNGYYLASS